MIVETGRLTIRDVGIKINDKLRDLSEVIEFTDQTIIENSKARIIADSFGVDYNGIKTKGVEKLEAANLVVPEGYDFPLSWEFIFGENPKEGNVQIFGRSQPLFTVEYLGHRERDIIQPLYEHQKTSYTPEYSETLHTIDDWTQYAVSIGAVFKSQFYGLEKEGYYKPSRKSGFKAEGFIFIQMDRYNGQVHIQPAIATVAQSDKLVRIKESNIIRSNGIREGGLLGDKEYLIRIATDLAEISIFSRMVNSSEISSVFQRRGFPLNIVNLWDRILYTDTVEAHKHGDLRRRDFEEYNDDFVKDYGVDWLNIVAQLPKDLVRIETERMFGIIQEMQSAKFPVKLT